MAEIECACAKFERLEGVAVQLYISQFLEETGVDEDAGETYYACKRCGRTWAQEMVEGKLLLTRMETDFIV